MKKNNKGFIATSILFGVVALLFITFAVILGNSHASLKSDKMYGNMLKGEITNFLGIKLYPNGGYVAQTKLEIDFNGTYGGEDENGNLKELPVPTRNGYAFEGWYTEKDGGQLVQAGTEYEKVKANRLYAHWKKDKFTLSIDPDGGTYDIFTTVSTYPLYFEEQKNIVVPTKTGYTFEGWELVGDGSKIDGTTFQMGYENATLKAKWKIKELTLTVDPQLGTWEGSTDIQVFNLKYEDTKNIPNPVRDGYTFTGWIYDSKTVSLSDTTLTMGPENVLLTAGWVVNNYRYIVRHHLEEKNDEFTLVEADTFEGEAEFGSIVKPPFNTYTGYIPIGKEKELLISSDVEKNVVDYRYAIRAFTLNIDANTGVYPGPLTYELFFDESVELLIPTKEGYTFTNWTVNAGEVVDNVYSLGDDTFDSLGDEGAKAVANWKANEYVLTLDPTGGNVENPVSSVTYDSTYGTYDDPVRVGYTFKGWSTTSDGKNIINENTIVKTASDHKLYAVWEANTYTVTLYLRGGISSTTSITVTYGDAYDELPTPTKDKHSFLGWFTDETIGTEVKNDTKVTTADDHNLYARWRPMDAEFIQYSNPSYTTCNNVACTLNELYQMFK